MKHIQTFESYVNSITEGKDFGDITAAIGGGDDSVFKTFFKSVKKGDTFEYAPNGVELDYIEKGDIGKKEVEVSVATTSQDAKPKVCTVLDKKKVALTGGSMEFEGEKQDAVYFSIEGDDKVYVLTNTFE